MMLLKFKLNTHNLHSKQKQKDKKLKSAKTTFVYWISNSTEPPDDERVFPYFSDFFRRNFSRFFPKIFPIFLEFVSELYLGFYSDCVPGSFRIYFCFFRFSGNFSRNFHHSIITIFRIFFWLFPDFPRICFRIFGFWGNFSRNFP